ncbi:hypothetical protein UC35_07110 [Ramlibacter tataouinensis]|uniref:Uncharacterized protein n=1 Tax=Ramlibacter tataouinensis TaxID=94132 RepID=A0A127JRU2_9BURK|nr:hypothetical protein UC35_07110 [Ramlibacter tataouinensis]
MLLSGWVQVLPGRQTRRELFLAHVWLYGVPIWEFEFRRRDLRQDIGMIDAEIVFLEDSPRPIMARTPIGLITPLTEPRLIDHTL